MSQDSGLKDKISTAISDITKFPGKCNGAVNVLRHFGAAAEEALPALATLFSGSNRNLRGAAAGAIGEIGAACAASYADGNIHSLGGLAVAMRELNYRFEEMGNEEDFGVRGCIHEAHEKVLLAYEEIGSPPLPAPPRVPYQGTLYSVGTALENYQAVTSSRATTPRP